RRINLKRNKLFICLAVFLLLSNILTPITAFAEEPSKRVVILDDKVTKGFEENEFVKLLVILEEQVDSEKLRIQLEQEVSLQEDNPKKFKNQIRNNLVNQLQETAKESQKSIKQFLDESKDQGSVEEYTEYFIVNGFALTATKEVAEELASRPEVKSVLLDEVKTLEPINTEELSNKIAEKSLSEDVEWHLDRIDAPAVWEKGITGEG